MFKSILIFSVALYLTACGGEASDPSPQELARLQTMPTFTVVDEYEVFINTLIDQATLIDPAQLTP
jgi:hypothetical protein